MPVSFIKMHGLGNDFVIVDARPDKQGAKIALFDQPKIIQRIADRRKGIGCDQLIRLDAADDGSDIAMRIYNADGGMAESCGNAARCVARLIMEEKKKDKVTINMTGMRIVAQRQGDLIAVDMGKPKLEWRDIPLSEARDTLDVDVGIAGLPKAVAVNMGNPHAVFFVTNAEDADVAGLGPRVERHALFPQRTNTEFAQIISKDKIRMRVWERGAGITPACGSGACATLVAAVRKGLTNRTVEMQLDGGILRLEWPEGGEVRMIGPASYSFRGDIADELLSVS
jgi:diaminopimelate epimerase